MGFLKSISATASLIFQIVLVVAAVAAFSYFDPFELLAPTKRTLKNTPIQVQSIKEIGQLITAEYYGEVIGSLDELLTREALNEIDSFNYQIDALHDDFVDAIDSIAARKIKRNDIYPAFSDEYEDLLADSLFDFYAYFINEKLKNRNYTRREINKKLSNDDTKKLIRDLGLERKDRLREDLHSISTAEIQENFRYSTKKLQTKLAKKRRLVILGRGWVKAGFDFGSFTEKNFIYDGLHKRAIFIGLQPEILVATINPWFIPEEGVEGFEFVIVERKVKNDPEWTKRVKQLCLDKLTAQATRKNILDQAQTNAEFHLKNLFSLLAGDQIEDIRFFTDYLDYSLGALLNDSVLRDDELPLVEEMIAEARIRDGQDFKPINCQIFLDSLRHAEKTVRNCSFELNAKSGILFKILQDQKIDSADIRYFEALKDSTFYDMVWFECFRENKKEAFTSYHSKTNTAVIGDLNRIRQSLKLPVDSTLLDYLR
ncbi:hypothetical protein [Mangrovibacterium sp.]|uniref:hypothetical protein n=1 Tax=Mangrovibacterium sp. TaxID=1961364 RepID=UPI00356644A0